MNLSDLFTGMFSRPQADHQKKGQLCYTPVRSKEAEKFTLFIDSKALDFLKKYSGVDLAALEKLPDLVYKKCVDLGFYHGNNVHFLLEVVVARNERTAMTIAKFEEPM